jgi:hypothetical protein
MKYRLSSIIAITLAMSIQQASANEALEGALVTDRPDAAESSETVGKNRFQMEAGFGVTQEKSAGATARSYGFPTLLRYGIVDPLEARIEGEIANFQTATGQATQRGFTDFAVGLKGHFVDNSGAVPSFGALVHLGLPTGNDDFSSNGVEPSGKVLADWELPGGFELGTNVGMDVPVRDAVGDKFARLLYAAAIGRNIPGTGERLRMFVEGQGSVALKKGKTDEHTFDTGLSLLLTRNVQLDLSTQIGLNADAADLAGGLGISFRL